MPWSDGWQTAVIYKPQGRVLCRTEPKHTLREAIDSLFHCVVNLIATHKPVEGDLQAFHDCFYDSAWRTQSETSSADPGN